MHPELDQLELNDLVDKLEDLEGRRTPVGWSPDDAVEKVAIERRILSIIGADASGEERRQDLRLPCELTVKLRSKEKSVKAGVRDLGLGGVFIETEVSFAIGTHVDVEVRGRTTDEYGLRVRGKIAWVADGDRVGVGVCFTDQPSAAHERRLRRFVLELLRHRIHN